MSKTRMTDDDIAEIYRRHQLGHSAAKITRDLALKPGRADYWIQRKGKRSPIGMANFTPERRREIATMGGKTTASKPGHMARIGVKGGSAHSRAHMAKIGTVGGINRRNTTRAESASSKAES